MGDRTAEVAEGLVRSDGTLPHLNALERPTLVIRRGATTMFVSRGLGTVYVPVRINCPPEVAVLTLQPRAA